MASKTGTAGNDTLNGTNNADFLDGRGGNDTIYGRAGDDDIYGWTGDDTLYGDDGIDYIFGEDGDDDLYGGDHADSLDGGAGHDYLDGWTGNDTLLGGSGNDDLYGWSGNDLLYGNNGIDYLFGEVGNDTLYGDANADSLEGGDGHDTLYGGSGNDTLLGGLDDDFLYGQGGADTLDGGDGNDALDGGDGADSIRGGAGNDVLIDGPENGLFYDTLEGGGGSDFLIGGGYFDWLDGGPGADILFDKGGQNYLIGGGGDDIIGYFAEYSNEFASVGIGGAGSDAYIWTGDEEDYLYNGWGYFVVTDFELGSDVISVLPFVYLSLQFGFSNPDPFDPDFLYLTYDETYFLEGYPTATPGATHLWWDADGADGPAQFYVVLTVLGVTYPELADADNYIGLYERGTNSNDTLNGAGDGDLLVGRDGNDTLDGGAGKDTMVGGAGRDTYYVDNADDKLNEEFTNEPAPAAGGPPALDDFTDTVVAAITYSLEDSAFVENLTLEGTAANGTGNVLNNVITGNANANALSGLGGADTVRGSGAKDALDGGAGNDILAGGTGKDTLTGGGGQDKFDFNTALNPTSNVDRITDFSLAGDLIRLDRDVFTALAVGTLAAARFDSGPNSMAADSGDRIIYNETNGNLYYDPDGTGAAAAKLFAILAGAPAIDQTDFLIVA
jgi:Ca2+-binding RTX toxin-like protein